MAQKVKLCGIILKIATNIRYITEWRSDFRQNKGDISIDWCEY